MLNIQTNTQPSSYATAHENCRYYLTYSGVQLPLNLVNELEPTAISNRNTYFLAHFDGAGRVVLCQKVVYGEIEMAHRYPLQSQVNDIFCALLDTSDSTREQSPQRRPYGHFPSDAQLYIDKSNGVRRITILVCIYSLLRMT